MKKLLEKVLRLMEEHEYNATSLTEVEYCTTCGSHILSEYGNRIDHSKDCEYVKAMQGLKRTIKTLKENKERLNHKTITQEEKCWPKAAHECDGNCEDCKIN